MRIRFRPTALFRFVKDPPWPRKLGAFQISLLAHAAAVAAIVLIPLMSPETPEHGDYVKVLIYNPPPPPPPPLPFGSGVIEVARRQEPAESPDRSELVVPVETTEPVPTVVEATPAEPEAGGNESGSAAGVPEGMEGGNPEGEIGGTPGGIPGGVIGGTGDEVLDFDQAPRLLKTVKPVYPEEAFTKKIEGTVVLGCSVGPDGKVRKAWVIRSTNPILDRSAIDAVMQWSFAPAVKGGRPVATVINAPVSFRIF